MVDFFFKSHTQILEILESKNTSENTSENPSSNTYILLVGHKSNYGKDCEPGKETGSAVERTN